MSEAAYRDGHVRLRLGLYVLGALPEPERTQVERHLAGCAACQAEHADLSDLPPLLDLLDEQDIREIEDGGPA